MNAVRGRWLRAAGWMLLLLGALALVVWRQSLGLELERAQRVIEARNERADAERVEVTRSLQTLQSRARVVRHARDSLNMRLPEDDEIVLIPVPRADIPAPSAVAAAREEGP